MALADPQDLETQLRERLAFVERRLPLLERCVELASASLVELQQRLARLRDGFEQRPRRTLGPRLARLQDDLGLIRRQIERLAERIRRPGPPLRGEKRGAA